MENAYGTSGRFGSAIQAFNTLRARGQMRYTKTNIPAGALVFSSNPRLDREFCAALRIVRACRRAR